MKIPLIITKVRPGSLGKLNSHADFVFQEKNFDDDDYDEPTQHEIRMITMEHLLESKKDSNSLGVKHICKYDILSRLLPYTPP